MNRSLFCSISGSKNTALHRSSACRTPTRVRILGPRIANFNNIKPGLTSSKSRWALLLAAARGTENEDQRPHVLIAPLKNNSKREKLPLSGLWWFHDDSDQGSPKSCRIIYTTFFASKFIFRRAL